MYIHGKMQIIKLCLLHYIYQGYSAYFLMDYHSFRFCILPFQTYPNFQVIINQNIYVYDKSLIFQLVSSSSTLVVIIFLFNEQLHFNNMIRSMQVLHMTFLANYLAITINLGLKEYSSSCISFSIYLFQPNS